MNKIKESCDRYVFVLTGQLTSLRERRDTMICDLEHKEKIREIDSAIARTEYALTIVKIIQSADRVL